jgi:hypothetical protein
VAPVAESVNKLLRNARRTPEILELLKTVPGWWEEFVEGAARDFGLDGKHPSDRDALLRLLAYIVYSPRRGRGRPRKPETFWAGGKLGAATTPQQTSQRGRQPDYPFRQKLFQVLLARLRLPRDISPYDVIERVVELLKNRELRGPSSKIAKELRKDPELRKRFPPPRGKKYDGLISKINTTFRKMAEKLAKSTVERNSDRK